MENSAALPASPVKAHSRFPLLITLAMILVVFVGFGPTFYWKPVITSAPLSTVWVVLHVLSCTAWMLLLVTQALLVSSQRVDVHRKLGVAGVVLLFLIMPLGWVVAFDFIARNQELVLATLILISAAFVRLPVIGPLGPPWTGIPMWIFLGCVIAHDLRGSLSNQWPCAAPATGTTPRNVV